MAKNLKNNIEKPPVLLRLVLSFLLNHKHPDTVLADFDEQFCLSSRERGRFAAVLWFWSQILLIIPSFVSNSIYWSVTMFKSYFVTALRNMRKRKTYSFINITGLAVGFACCFLILHYIIDELTFDTFHKDSERIFRVVRVMPDIHGPSTRNPLAPTLKTDFAEVEYSVRVWHPSEAPTIINGDQCSKKPG